MISTILPQLRQFGQVNRSWLGIGIRELDDSLRASLGLPNARGALVDHVDSSGPAASAGLRPGDVIQRFDGQEIQNSNQLPWLASTAGIGHRSTLHVRRGTQELDLNVTLQAMPEVAVASPQPQQALPPMVPVPRGRVPQFVDPWGFPIP